MSEMDDRAIEALLQRYRPVGPPPALTFARPPRTWPWAVAAAALLALTIGLHATTVVGGAAPPPIDPAPLAQQLGGDDLAYRVAELIVASQPAPSQPPAAQDAAGFPWIQ